MEDNKFRHELKHFIGTTDYYVIRSRLSAVAQIDANAGADGKYTIRSLYFDNTENKVLREKLDGIGIREKFRLRFYNGNTGFIRLEKKSKVDGLCKKQSTFVTEAQCEALIAGDPDWAAGDRDILLAELGAKMKYQRLRPETIVEYTREAFVFAPGNVRVTFDYDIRTGVYSKRFLDADFRGVPATEGAIILEVKFDEFLPGIIRDIVQAQNSQQVSFSKYAACRIFG